MKKNLFPFLGSHSGPLTIDFERLHTSSCTILELITTSHAHLALDIRCFFDAFAPFLSLLAYHLYFQILSLVSHETAPTKVRAIIMTGVQNKK